MKIEIEKLSTAELIEIVKGLMATVETLTEENAELKRQLNQNSGNSSNPSSVDKWKRPKIRNESGGNPGGQKGHKGNFIEITREADEVTAIKPEKCAKCGEDLSVTMGTVSESRSKIDVEIRTKIRRYEQIEVVCPCCGNENREEFPEKVKGHISYGEGVQSTGVLLTQYANVSYDKTRKIMNDVFGVPISTGTIVNHVSEFASKCDPVTVEIAEKVRGSVSAHFDETSSQVNGIKYWLHTASTAEATYNTVHKKRGKEGTDDNGVLKGFGGVAVHDCLPQYFSYDNCLHAVCNAHLLRDLQGVIENTGQQWAVSMQQLLREMKLTVDDYKEAGKPELPTEYINFFGNEYNRIVTIGEAENPLTEAQKKKKTEKRSKPRNLLDRFIGYRGEITRFTENFAVPFDNNQAERDIRNTKVKMKVSGGFRSEEGAKNYGKISSVIGTAVKQGKSAFRTVSDIFSGSLKSIFLKTQTEQ